VEIEIENPVIKLRSYFFQDPVELCQAIELMAVQDEIALSIGCGVNDFTGEHNRAEIDIDKLFEEFVVVAGDIYDFGILPAFAKEFLDEHVVFIPPMPFALQLPAVNNVANQIKIFAFEFSQKIQQGIDLRVAGAEMHVRDPDRAVLLWPGGDLFRCCDHIQVREPTSTYSQVISNGN
jgi:hypothetical protein